MALVFRIVCAVDCKHKLNVGITSPLTYFKSIFRIIIKNKNKKKCYINKHSFKNIEYKISVYKCEFDM